MGREKIEWEQVLKESMPLNIMLNTLPTKGNLVYEYNPLRNYRLTSNKYWYKNNFYSLKELETDFNITLSKDKKSWIGIPITQDDPILYEAGQLIDFVTDELTFSLEHPVNIVPQYSYDGSVNLILNDGLNIPRLINTRFSATGRNTYKIIDRKGNTDTNIYDQGEQFNIDTSLYKIVDDIPQIKFLRASAGGNLKVGNYHFYFKLADADGNETDFVAESGLVSLFIGEGSYSSIYTGNKNENSTKQVEFGLSNIDAAYDYIIVYFSRTTAENDNNSITEYVKIDKKFSKTNQKLVITGFENFEPVTVTDINLHYNIVNSACTQTVCQNMLFMGNVKKQDIPYDELQDLSLRILPFLGTEEYDPGLNADYQAKNPRESYINANFIYNKTGYWPGEYYRFGIVYILPNGELTPVFNIRGAYGIGDNTLGYTHIDVLDKEKSTENDEVRQFIKYNENTYLLAEDSDEYINDKNIEPGTIKNCYSFENVKGVCVFNPPVVSKENADIYYANFYIPSDVRKQLKNYIKGYFFVRQTRIPVKLAQGITVGIDNESRTPTIPTAGGALERLSNTLEQTYVETENINGLNYISEGFLKRYSFRFKKKSSGIWSSIGKVMGIAALVVGTIAVGIVTAGGGFAAAAAAYGTIAAATATATVAAAVAGTAALAAGAVTAVVATVQEVGLAVARIGEKKRLNGKNTVAPSGYKIVETDDSRQLTDSFDDRIIIKDDSKNQVQGIICPDYTVNQPYYNQVFTGNEHYIEVDQRQSNIIEAYSNESYFTNDYRHFYIDKYTNIKTNSFAYSKVVAVPDNISCVGIDNILFRSRAGEAEEAWRYKCVGEKVTEVSDSSYQQINSDIIRGSFGPYLGFINGNIGPAKIVNIYIPGYNPSNIQEYMEIRMCDNSTYHAITDRKNINDFQSRLVGDINSGAESIWEPAYRGDCYICQFTQRINRNFNDPSAPYNDEIVDINTWRDNYDPSNTEKYSQINLGDVNAIPLGMWVTFQLRSSNNLNIRSLDGSNVDEAAMTGNPRGYFPVQPMSTEGVFKKPESQIYNKGFAKSVSDRWNIEVPDVPHIKNWFGTRIMYSDIHITDAYKNGFRVFQGQNYRDYTRSYGEIVKLVSFEDSLLCVFEHGVALISVNERTVAGQGAGGNVYINTSNVLPENPKIISDVYGSQWPESILKVPGKTGDAVQYVYGVDTVAKKIWRTNGQSLECISDFKVQEFLNNNITLGERELTPKIGIRNVKTHYNAFKRDVMFTFYDGTYGCEEKVWNLCWNELLQKFITFYSWVPSYMENINNVPFSFDRNTSKWIAKLGVSHSENSFADGITLTNVIIEDSFRSNGAATNNLKIPVEYITKEGTTKTIYVDVSKSISYLDGDGNWKYSTIGLPKFVAGLSLSNRTLPDKEVHYRIDFELLKDSWGNYKLFKITPLKDFTCIKEDGSTYITSGELTLPNDAMFPGAVVPVYALCFNDSEQQEKALFRPEALYSELYYRNTAGNSYADYDINKIGTDSITQTNVPQQQIIDEETLAELEKQYEGIEVIVGNTSTNYTQDNPPPYVNPCTTLAQIRSLIKYDKDGTPRVHGSLLSQYWTIATTVNDQDRKVWYELPIFKDITGKRLMLPKEQQINPDKLVTLLNIKATINIVDDDNNDRILSDTYYDSKAKYAQGSILINSGQYESTVAIAPRWNLQFLTTDFWKHGQAGIIDITDEIFPTYWYGKQHPFEFEVVVVNDPSVHKIFSNLELIANKAKPESFHYEIIGECYDFAKDKPNMYFRQEALKALWQYNGADITYNRDFLKVQPKQQPKSADLPHRYYSRQDIINDIEDYYISITYPKGYDYRHLSGAEIVRYSNRQEYRIWNHAKAVCLDDLSQDDTRSIIAANCQYLEDRWKVTINPILVCYRNEYTKKIQGSLIQPQNSLWVKSVEGESLPRLPIYNSPIPDKVLQQGEIKFPDTSTGEGKDNALYGLYADLYSALDPMNWLKDNSIYNTNFGEAQNRKELDLKDKFMKVRIRYSGEELAVIDFLNTIYRVSYA